MAQYHGRGNLWESFGLDVRSWEFEVATGYPKTDLVK